MGNDEEAEGALTVRLFKKAPRSKWNSLPGLRWYVEFRDHIEAIRRIALFTDRRASEEIAKKIDTLVAYKVSGMPPDVVLAKWLDSLPSSLLQSLVEIGLVDSTRVAIVKPLLDHLEDFKLSVAQKGRTQQHTDLLYRRVKKVLDGCGFRYWPDISGSKVSKYLADVHDEGRGLSAQTVAYYAQAVGQFCKWMRSEGRVKDDPLGEVIGFNVHTDRRHDRRALTVDELRRLLQAARTGPVLYGLTGEERHLLYTMAAETGLRANELRTLTVNCLDLDAKPPTVTVYASYSKHRSEDTIPLRPETAERLREHLRMKLPDARALKVPDKTAKMIRADLEAAGIEYKDARGRFRDFHALRHTFITNLVNSGVHPRTAQALARHSTIDLTMNTYTHSVLDDQASALDKLPDLGPVEPKADEKTATG